MNKTINKLYSVWDTETGTIWPGGKTNKFVWGRKGDAANAWNAHMIRWHKDKDTGKLVKTPNFTEQTRYVTVEVEILPVESVERLREKAWMYDELN